MLVRVVVTAGIALGALGCTEEGPAPLVPDSGVVVPDAGPTVKEWSWSMARVDTENAGFQPDIQRAPDGSIGIAYYRRAAEIGTCPRVDGDPPLLRWDVVYAQGDGVRFDKETIATVDLLAPPGLSLAFDQNGEPAVAFVGGTEALRRCGASDLLLARRSGGAWNTTTLAVDSTGRPVFTEDQDQCAAGQDQCNLGDVVGEWSSITFMGGDPLVAFRDIHFGFTQDDELRSDVELYWQGVMTLDAGWGGGTYARIVVRDGRPIIVHANAFPSTYGSGIWMLTHNEAEWIRTKISPDVDIGYRLGLAVTGDRLGLAYHAKADQKLIYYESDDASTWRREVVDTSGNTGFSPWLVFDARGDPAISFHHCGRYDPRSPDCEAGTDSLRFAYRKGGKWTTMQIDAATERTGFDGHYTALAFDGGGNAIIAYQAIFPDPITLDTIRELRVAKGELK